MRGLEKRHGIERANAVWAVAENWAAGSEELEPSWRVQPGVGSDGDLWETMKLLLEGMEGKVEVHWVRGHEDERTTRRMMSTHQRGNVKADVNCTAIKRGTRSKARLLLPRRGGDGRGVQEGAEGQDGTERLMKYFRDTRGWGEDLDFYFLFVSYERFDGPHI